MASKMYEVAFKLGAKISSTFNSSFSTAQKQVSNLEKKLNSVSSSSEKAHKSISNISKNAAGLITTIAGGAGLVEFASSAIEAGNNTYMLSQKMHISAAEASNLNRMLKLSGTDSQPFISTMLRLDKGLESAGKNGNATSKALQQYGISLTDTKGKLLPMNEQLSRLAAAYQKAADSGNEEAFTASVLGAKGASLTSILANYSDVAAEAAKTKGIGIDPELAHKVSLEIASLKSQTSQFGLVAGNAVLPIISKMLPPIQKGFSNLAGFIKNNQVEIKRFGDNTIAIGTSISTKVMPVAKGLFDFVANHGKASQAIIIGMVGAFAGFKTINGITSTMNKTIKTFKDAHDNINKVREAVEKFRKSEILASAATKAGDLTLKAHDTANKISTGITKAFTAAQKAFNAVMKANTVFIVVAAIIALVSILVVAYNKNKVFHDFVIKTWNAIKDGAISLCKGIVNAFTPIEQFLIGVFKGAWNGIKSFINLMVSGINILIGGLSSIKVDVPSWVPGIGGKSLGINIPKIPMLAQGGYIQHRSGGILANIGEGSEDEIVSPISKLKSVLNTEIQRPSINFSPQIIIQGSASRDDIYQAILMTEAEFERKMDNYFRKRQRLSLSEI